MLTQQRLRITFGKHGTLRFVGHLALVTTWERILRRAEIPLEYTRGFNPRPRLQFAAALAVGITSDSEMLDAWLTAPLEGDFPTTWITRLQAKSPAGLHIHSLQNVPIKSPSLPPQVLSAKYVIAPLDPGLTPEDLRRRADALWAQETIERAKHKKKRGKKHTTYDLRPLILGLDMDSEGQLIAQLRTGEHSNGRPDELIDALGLEMSAVRIHRRSLVLNPNV